MTTIKTNDLEQSVPEKFRGAVRALKTALVEGLVPPAHRADHQGCVYGVFYGDVDQPLYRVIEVGVIGGDGASGLAIQNCVAENLGILRACEDFLETYGLKPHRPQGWTTDLDEHGDAAERLRQVLYAPNDRIVRLVTRRLLTAADAAPDQPVGLLLTGKFPEGGELAGKTLLWALKLLAGVPQEGGG